MRAIARKLIRLARHVACVSLSGMIDLWQCLQDTSFPRTLLPSTACSHSDFSSNHWPLSNAQMFGCLDATTGQLSSHSTERCLFGAHSSANQLPAVVRVLRRRYAGAPLSPYLCSCYREQGNQERQCISKSDLGKPC